MKQPEGGELEGLERSLAVRNSRVVVDQRLGGVSLRGRRLRRREPAEGGLRLAVRRTAEPLATTLAQAVVVVAVAVQSLLRATSCHDNSSWSRVKERSFTNRDVSILCTRRYIGFCDYKS